MSPQERAQAAINAPQSAPKSEFSDIRNLFNSSFALDSIGPAVGSLQTQDATTVANQRAAAAAGRRAQSAKIQERIDELKKLFDPKEYQQVQRPDGGFDFLDPLGNQISVKQYAKIQGKKLPEVLKDSENLKDRQFLSDKKALEELLEKAAENDFEFFDQLREEQPEFAASLKNLDRGGDALGRELSMIFRRHYAEYFSEFLNRGPAGDRAFPGLGPDGSFTPTENPFGGL